MYLAIGRFAAFKRIVGRMTIPRAGVVTMKDAPDASQQHPDLDLPRRAVSKYARARCAEQSGRSLWKPTGPTFCVVFVGLVNIGLDGCRPDPQHQPKVRTYLLWSIVGQMAWELLAIQVPDHHPPGHPSLVHMYSAGGIGTFPMSKALAFQCRRQTTRFMSSMAP